MIARLVAVVAIAALASPLLALPAAAGAEPRALHAGAVHRHGSCEPLPPNSPGSHGVRRRADGSRVHRASARHPFAVGHHLQLGDSAVALWLPPAGVPHARPVRLGFGVPLSVCPR